MTVKVLRDIDGGWLHPSFMELQDYLGPAFKPNWCEPGEEKARDDRAAFKGTDEEWTAETHIFAYQNIALAVMGIHRPYIAKLLEQSGDRWGLSVLDYGAGGGQVGIGLHYLGYKVSFADIPSASLMWLMWRLRKLRLDLPVYAIHPDIEIPHHDAVLCFDVLEHLPETTRESILIRLGEIGSIVLVNLVRDEEGTEGVHHALDFEAVTAFVRSRYPMCAEDFYPGKDGKPRQRLLIYGNVKIA